VKAWIEGKKRTGPWKVRWREVVNGKKIKRASPSFTTLSEVNAELEAVNLRLAKLGALQPRRRTTLLPIAQVVERWKRDSLKDGSVRQHYADEVERTLVGKRGLCTLQGWQYTNQITADAVSAWRSTKPRGHTKPIAMVKAMMRWARSVLKQPIDDELLTLAVLTPPPRPSPPLLTADQVDAIVARAYTFGESIGAAIEHLTIFGCRPIDLCRLNVANWNRTTRTLTHQTTKSRTRPSHPIKGPFEAHAKRLDRLTAGHRPDAPLFLSPTGERWAIDARGTAREIGDWYWWHLSAKLPQIAAIQRGIGCLKDYAISNLEAAGVDDRTKALFTGHRTLSVFERYKTTNDERAEAALGKLGALAAKAQKREKQG
jgi:integrase